MRPLSRFFLVLALLATPACSFIKSRGKSAATSKATSTTSEATDAPPEYEVKSKLDYAKQNITNYCPLADEPPNDWDRCKTELGRARKTVDDVHPIRRTMSIYVEVSDLVKKTEAKMPGWDKAIAADKTSRAEAEQLGKDFSADVRPHEDALSKVSGYKLAKPEFLNRQTSAKDLDEVIAHGESLAELAKLCEGKYKGKRIPTIANPDTTRHPRNACDLALNWKDYVRKALPGIAAQIEDKQRKSIEGHLERLEKDGVYWDSDFAPMADPAKLVADSRKAFEPAYQKLGVDMPAELFASLSDVAKRYPEVLKKAGGQDRWPPAAKHHDKDAEKPVTAAVKEAGGKLEKIALVSPDWLIIKNDVDLPLRKIRTAVVAVKRKGEGFCRLYDVNAVAEYQGGGVYAKPQATFEADKGTVVSRCP